MVSNESVQNEEQRSPMCERGAWGHRVGLAKQGNDGSVSRGWCNGEGWAEVSDNGEWEREDGGGEGWWREDGVGVVF
jgi:hypothetical protein